MWVCKSDVISAICRASSMTNGTHIGQSSTDFVFATLIRKYTCGYVSYVLLHRTDHSMWFMQNIPVVVLVGALTHLVSWSHGVQLGLLRLIASVASLAPSRDLLSTDAVVLWACQSKRISGSCVSCRLAAAFGTKPCRSRVAWAEVCSTGLILFGPFGHELLLTLSILRFGITYTLIVTCSVIRIFAPEEQEV